ncbi:MAG: CsgG/HfaB family protein [Blastocatellia bacterium]|nr:CsgG/HfaB family protein [Blastocatellia bacterium]
MTPLARHCLVIGVLLWLGGLSPILAQTKKDEKIRLAVAPQADAITQNYGVQVLESTMTDALVKMGRYEVVARSQLDKVLAEQRLNNSQLVDPKAAQSVGKLLGAKYIVVPQIQQVNFEPGVFTKDKYTTRVQIQLLDVTTGSIKISDTFTGQVTAFAMQRVPNTNTLTPQEANKKFLETLNLAALQFIDRINLLTPLEGYVVAVEGNRVALNLGEPTGIKPGQEFLVIQEGKQIKDPATGEVLSSEKKKIARLLITQVEAKLAWAEIVATYSTAASVPVGSETVDLYPASNLVQQLMAVVQADSQAAAIQKELEKQRKKAKK